MDKKIASVVGAVAGLATLDTAAQATTGATPAPGELNGAQSFAELLEPIPNALALLRAADAAAARTETVGQAGPDVQVAQYHHHHHRYYRHHHHHHHRAIIIRPGGVYIRGHHHHHHRYHHHHHHHHY